MTGADWHPRRFCLILDGLTMWLPSSFCPCLEYFDSYIIFSEQYGDKNEFKFCVSKVLHCKLSLHFPCYLVYKVNGGENCGCKGVPKCCRGKQFPSIAHLHLLQRSVAHNKPSAQIVNKVPAECSAICLVIIVHGHGASPQALLRLPVCLHNKMPMTIVETPYWHVDAAQECQGRTLCTFMLPRRQRHLLHAPNQPQNLPRSLSSFLTHPATMELTRTC